MVQPGGNGARQLCHNTGALGLTVPNCCSHVVIIRVHVSGNFLLRLVMQRTMWWLFAWTLGDGKAFLCIFIELMWLFLHFGCSQVLYSECIWQSHGTLINTMVLKQMSWCFHSTSVDYANVHDKEKVKTCLKSSLKDIRNLLFLKICFDFMWFWNALHHFQEILTFYDSKNVVTF